MAEKNESPSTGDDRMVICFDLDDTLIPNTYLYNVPMLRAASIIAEELGPACPHPSELLSLYTDIDVAMVEELGMSVKRFPTSWVRTYQKLCADAGAKPKASVRKRILREAARFTRGPFVPFDGVVDLLDGLASQGHALHLVTAGDVGLQLRKIEESGLAPHFMTARVVPLEKRDALESLFAGEPRDRCMMVGDSLRSDMLPALDLGVHAVRVESRTWRYAEADLGGRHVRTIARVTELPGVLTAIAAERNGRGEAL